MQQKCQMRLRLLSAPVVVDHRNQPLPVRRGATQERSLRRSKPAIGLPASGLRLQLVQRAHNLVAPRQRHGERFVIRPPARRRNSELRQTEIQQLHPRFRH